MKACYTNLVPVAAAEGLFNLQTRWPLPFVVNYAASPRKGQGPNWLCSCIRKLRAVLPKKPAWMVLHRNLASNWASNPQKGCNSKSTRFWKGKKRSPVLSSRFESDAVRRGQRRKAGMGWSRICRNCNWKKWPPCWPKNLPWLPVRTGFLHLKTAWRPWQACYGSH